MSADILNILSEETLSSPQNPSVEPPSINPVSNKISLLPASPPTKPDFDICSEDSEGGDVVKDIRDEKTSNSYSNLRDESPQKNLNLVNIDNGPIQLAVVFCRVLVNTIYSHQKIPLWIPPQ